MKTYKNIYLYTIALLWVFIGSGCNDNIDLDPQGIISADGYFKSVDDYDKALNALYARLNIDKYDLWLDGTTDDALVTHSWNRGYQLGRGIGTTFSPFPKDKWEKDYISVNRANNVIEHIDSYEWPDGAQNKTRNQILAEAKTLRAYFYLDLVCLFGRIMFYEKNPATVAESMEIAQVEDIRPVFDFILKELDESIGNLPDQPANKSKIGAAAARLLRARAAAYAAGYLSDNSYFSITLSETEKLLAMPHSLGEYSQLFTSGNTGLTEVILAKEYNADKKNNYGDWYNNSIGGYCVTSPVKALVDAYEYMEDPLPNKPYTNKDPRFYASIYAPGTILRGKYYNTIPENTIEKDGKVYFDPAKDYGDLQDREVMIGDVLGEVGSGEWNKTPTGLTFKKYFAEEETWNTWNAYVIFRFGEAYLLRAEALAETGGSQSEAKELIKAIRDRAGNTNDIDEMITSKYGSLVNLIRNERRIEMAQEGLRIFDIRRWKIMLDVMNKPAQGIEYRTFSGNTPAKTVYNVVPEREFTEKDYWWPIPQSEIDLNKGRITQNKGWEK